MRDLSSSVNDKYISKISSSISLPPFASFITAIIELMYYTIKTEFYTKNENRILINRRFIEGSRKREVYWTDHNYNRRENCKIKTAPAGGGSILFLLRRLLNFRDRRSDCRGRDGAVSVESTCGPFLLHRSALRLEMNVDVLQG